MLLIGVGAVTDSAAEVSARADKAATLKVRWSVNADLSGSTVTGGVAVVEDDDFTGKVPIPGLPANREIHYDVLIDDVGTYSAPFPTFRTCPPAGVPASFNFAFVSCNLGPNGPGFKQVRLRDPLFLLHGGDAVYADATTLDKLRNGPDTATNTYWKPLYAPGTDWSTEIVRTMWRDHDWDDHEYFSNSGGKLPTKAISLKAFREYAVFHKLDDPSQGIGHTFTVAHCEFFVPDTRYNRGGGEHYPDPGLGVGGGYFLAPDATSSGTSLVFSVVSSKKRYNDAFKGWFCKNSDGVVERVKSSTYSAATQKHTCVLSRAMPNISSLQFHLRNSSLLDMDARGILERLVDRMNASTAAFKFFVSSVPFNKTATDWSDAWPGYDVDQIELLYLLQHVTALHVMTLSGDRHLQAMDDGTNAVWPEVLSSRWRQDSSHISGKWTQGYSENTEGWVFVEVTPTTVTFTALKSSDGSAIAGITPLVIHASATPPPPSGTLPTKPIILAIVPSIVVPVPTEDGLLETPWTEPVYAVLAAERHSVQWDAPPHEQTLTVDGRAWRLLGYVVAVIHPDAREELVYPGVYGASSHVNTAPYLEFTAPTPGRYGFAVTAIGQVEAVAA